MGADCSSERGGPVVRSLRPSPVVSSIGEPGGQRRGGRPKKPRAAHANSDEFDFDFEFDYDLESLSSAVHRGRPAPEPVPSLSSEESEYDPNASFIGYVPSRKLDFWFETLPTDTAELRPVPEEEVWSDGEQEAQQWLRTEASTYFYGGGKGGDGDVVADSDLAYRPHYVLAVGLQSEGEREEAEHLRRLQRQQQKQRQLHNGKKAPAAKKKTVFARCA